MKLSTAALFDVMKQYLDSDGSVDINTVGEKLNCPMYILSPLIEKLKEEKYVEQVGLSKFKILS